MLEQMIKKLSWYSFLTLLLSVTIVGILIYKNNKIPSKLSGVTVGNEYYATTTAPNAAGYLNDDNPTLIKNGAGALGSLIVVAAGTAGGNTNFYDATTTNATKRAATQATSSISMFSVPNNLAAGTYVYDINFSRGLLMDYNGTIGTTTTTYR